MCLGEEGEMSLAVELPKAVTAFWRITYYHELQAKQGPTGKLDKLSHLMLIMVCQGT